MTNNNFQEKETIIVKLENGMYRITILKHFSNEKGMRVTIRKYCGFINEEEAIKKGFDINGEDSQSFVM